MAPAAQVDLRVQVHGDQTVEFALHRPRDASSSRVSALCWTLAGASAVCVAAWHAWQWRHALYASALAAFLAVLAFKSAGAVVVEESLLVAPSLGVKLIKKRQDGSTAIRFIDQSDICAVVLNEAITFNDVVYCLALMVEGQTNMVLAYETFRPRVVVLQQVFREVKALLFPVGGPRQMRFPSSVSTAL